MDLTVDKCKGAFANAHGIHVYVNEMNHDMHLHDAMERTREAGLKLNCDKYAIKTKSFNFFGNIYTQQGVIPNPKKVEAIKMTLAPHTKQELQSF